MITSIAQLERALRQLKRVEGMCEAMRLHCAETNSPLFPVASEGYLAQIYDLESDINEYLREHASETLTPAIREQLESLVEPQTSEKVASVRSLV